MAVKALAQILQIRSFDSPTACEVRCHVRVPVSLGPYTSDPEGFVNVTVDPSGLSAGNNQQIRDAVKAWVQENFPTVVFVNGVDTVRLLGSF